MGSVAPAAGSQQPNPMETITASVILPFNNLGKYMARRLHPKLYKWKHRCPNLTVVQQKPDNNDKSRHSQQPRKHVFHRFLPPYGAYAQSVVSRIWARERLKTK